MFDYSKLPIRNVLCLDMKSFFASVEAVERGLDPMETLLVVVANKNRKGSVVLAASPKMKELYGIKTGSRFFEIPVNNKQIHIVESRMALYVNYASKVIQILEKFAPYEAIDVYSIDESWICTDGTEKLFGNRWEVARKIRETIYEETGLPSCIGIGPNKFLAKVILDIEAKKNGIAECKYKDVEDKLWPQKVEAIWGIGKRMQKNLNRMGIFKVGELATTPLNKLKERFGVMGEQLYWHSWGVDLSPVIQDWEFEEEQKSISTGITLMSDYGGEDTEIVILELCEEIGLRLRQSFLQCKTVYLGIEYSKDIGGGFGHSHTMNDYSCISNQIYKECISLFRKYYQGFPVRKVSVAVSNLQNFDNLQLKLFDEENQRDLSLSFALDEVKNKYGKHSIFKGVSLFKNATAKERANKIGGHNK
ncbi:Putative UV-damage repair protein UvrX [Candidatus Syntrophocurvum alkaliphilum]|uniref:UV-damage repair protein UvrX n=1 Tax=Candidatus Syntrophocurvum alkaliphilum TaxID=2293317 RepID=A0A6I6DIK3_9FIRM|nr:Putative UV-damage repair protein UvrX [Candidatus Syntrophocurvum alkaliphilum]